MKDDLLFVYGTLRRGGRWKMAHMLASHGEFIGEAVYRARLYRVADYPCAVPSANPADRVRGDVYSLRDPASLLPLLDEYEGCGAGSGEPAEYVRRCQEIQLLTGKTLSAWVYLYNRPVDGLERIMSGDFFGDDDEPIVPVF